MATISLNMFCSKLVAKYGHDSIIIFSLEFSVSYAKLETENWKLYNGSMGACGALDPGSITLFRKNRPKTGLLKSTKIPVVAFFHLF